MNENKQITLKDRLLFIIPSLIGILLFMIPVPSQDGVTIPIAILSNALQDLLGDHIPSNYGWHYNCGTSWHNYS